LRFQRRRIRRAALQASVVTEILVDVLEAPRTSQPRELRPPPGAVDRARAAAPAASALDDTSRQEILRSLGELDSHRGSVDRASRLRNIRIRALPAQITA
jgi:hypothetical protein